MSKPKNLVFKVNKEWAELARTSSWATILEFAEDKKGNTYARKQGSEVVYLVINSDPTGKFNCKCAKCDSEVLGARIAHPIWDGPFPCSGSGKCHYETVPYCPNCEKQPNFHGSPITVPFEW
ncbi:hypothetical protein HZA97_08830 [Candidatus Woesearchaeota archaeon]|nr:hypothetical protein [Candidatus Woesearchaeota archaeon]